MKILGIEFSTPHRSVAVLEVGAGGREIRRAQTVQTRERNTQGLRMTRQVLEEAGLRREEIDHIVVGLGPGSLTGIRIAISMAQGWSLGHPVRWLGISAFDCLAELARAAGKRGEIEVRIDLKCREFGRARFRLGAAVEPLGPVERVAADDLPECPGPGCPMLGPDLDRVFAGAQSLHPEALTLCRMAVARRAEFSNEPLNPVIQRVAQFVKAPPPRHIE